MVALTRGVMVGKHPRGSSPVPLRRPGSGKVLVARWIGIVSAAWRVISTCGSSADSSRADAYCHSTAYGCSTIDTSSIDAPPVHAAVISTSATNTSATTASISEGVS